MVGLVAMHTPVANEKVLKFPGMGHVVPEDHAWMTARGGPTTGAATPHVVSMGGLPAHAEAEHEPRAYSSVMPTRPRQLPTLVIRTCWATATQSRVTNRSDTANVRQTLPKTPPRPLSHVASGPRRAAAIEERYNQLANA